MRTGITVDVTANDRQRLAAIVADRNSPQKHVWRANIVLLTADGCGTAEIMHRSGASKTAVWRWQARFMTEGVSGLLRDKSRPSRIPPLTAEVEDKVVRRTLGAPDGEATHWTGPAMAKAIRSSVSSVQRIWRKKGRCGPITHDYQRHGTTTLFAALNILDGTVFGRCMQKHRHQEFIRFLNAVDASVPPGRPIHAIVDNYATHKHPKVRAWLKRHPRWTFHFTPTSASWLNAVEGFFAKLTKRRLKFGVFRSIIELQSAIKRFLAEANDNPRSFIWTKDPEKIIAAVKRGHQALDSIH